MKVEFSYLKQKFTGCLDEGHPILENKRKLIQSGDFTLGEATKEFERKVADLMGAKYAIGVANGTDALRIGLRAVGVRPGDDVITAANTFVASAGCIDELFATPKFCDMGPNYTLDPSLLEKAITPKTKAIVPVHFTGEPCEMDVIMDIANKHGIPVVEDLCQAYLAEFRGKCVGNFGACGAISFHPLKVLNVWGDGGMIVTNEERLYEWISRYRNHGLKNRDEISYFGCNSRFDTDQAIVGSHLISETRESIEKRRYNARYYDERLRDIRGVYLAPRRSYAKSCYHLYFIEVDPNIRNHLVDFLNRSGVEAKVHYPKPLQGVLEMLGYGRADFPKAYEQSDKILTLPGHDHLTTDEMDYVILKISEFMRAR